MLSHATPPPHPVASLPVSPIDITSQSPHFHYDAIFSQLAKRNLGASFAQHRRHLLGDPGSCPSFLPHHFALVAALPSLPWTTVSARFFLSISSSRLPPHWSSGQWFSSLMQLESPGKLEPADVRDADVTGLGCSPVWSPQFLS